jgi:hypothetical protein
VKFQGHGANSYANVLIYIVTVFFFHYVWTVRYGTVYYALIIIIIIINANTVHVAGIENEKTAYTVMKHRIIGNVPNLNRAHLEI